MQLDTDLTLEKAVRMARQREEVKKQQTSLRGDKGASEAMSVDRVFKGSSKPAKNKPQRAHKLHSAQNSKGKGAQSKC